MGYTPVFESIYTGTLYGRWPAAAVWASLLPLFDRNGNLDMSLEALCGMTGWPRDLLEQGIRQLMEPDQHSRTKGHDGRRMILLDPERSWGWKCVNHGFYREKSRLMSKSAVEVASGKNAERLRTAGDRRSPPVTAAHRPSDADSYSDLNKAEEAAAFDTSECPRDMDAASEHKTFCEWCGEKAKAPTAVRWRRWVDGAKQSGRYAKQKPRPPTEEEIRAERNRIARAQS